jgi:hypothetical protein
MIVKLCDALSPFLISKKRQCLLLKKYALSRLANAKMKGRGPGSGGFSKREVSLMEKLQALNKLGPKDTSTTLRGTFKRQGKNRKRWLAKFNEDKV